MCVSDLRAEESLNLTHQEMVFVMAYQACMLSSHSVQAVPRVMH
jgi:hypothetical protein